MTTSASQIFNFLRGAVRSAFGTEEFRGKRIILVGMDTRGQELLAMLCFDDVKLFFWDKSVVNYSKAHMVCSGVESLAPGKAVQDIDIFRDLGEGVLSVDGNVSKDFRIEDIDGEDAYNHGIHEYYCQ